MVAAAVAQEVVAAAVVERVGVALEEAVKAVAARVSQEVVAAAAALMVTMAFPQEVLEAR